MTVAFLLYLSHLFYYLPLPEVYYYLDPFYQLFNLLVYPMYYIYIRLLTVDEKFSLRKHGVFLLPPLAMFVLYGTGVLIMSKEEHIRYLYDALYSDTALSGILLYQKSVYILCRIVFILQGLVYMWLSFRLVVKNKKNVLNYYANMEADSLDKIHILNITLSITIAAGILMSIFGKESFMSEGTRLLFPSIIFSVMLFFIGWLGNKQRPVLTNSIDFGKKDDCEQKQDKNQNQGNTEQLQHIKHKLLQLFEEEKIYLNKELTIWDVASVIGTNRTYISTIINNDLGQNFSGFVNAYRVQYARTLLAKNSQISKENLAEMSGFGSVSSMQRSFAAYDKNGE
jgi:AraC-like DNA-binding protein